MYVDPWGLYDRAAATEYAVKYSVMSGDDLVADVLSYDSVGNPPYVRFEQDCTNFVSFCLFLGGGMHQSDDWYYNWTIGSGEYVTGSYSATWTNSEEQFKAFTNCTGEFPNTNYANAIAICIHESKWIATAIEIYNIQKEIFYIFFLPKQIRWGILQLLFPRKTVK